MVVIFGFGPTEDFDPCPKAPQVEHGHCGGSVTPLSTNGLRIFCTLPYFVMAFTCQQNAFNAIGELRNPTKGQQATVVMCTPILPTILYLTIAVCGYLTFGRRVPSNIINGYPTSSPIVSAARCILGVVVLCNYPLQLFPCRIGFSPFGRVLEAFYDLGPSRQGRSRRDDAHAVQRCR